MRTDRADGKTLTHALPVIIKDTVRATTAIGAGPTSVIDEKAGDVDTGTILVWQHTEAANAIGIYLTRGEKFIGQANGATTVSSGRGGSRRCCRRGGRCRANPIGGACVEANTRRTIGIAATLGARAVLNGATKFTCRTTAFDDLAFTFNTAKHCTTVGRSTGDAFAWIYGDARDAIASKSGIAGAREAAGGIAAGRIGITVVGTVRALIDVCADRSVARISRIAGAREAAGGVAAGRIDITVVGSRRALIDIDAPRSSETWLEAR